jgi:hypothetical protein
MDPPGAPMFFLGGNVTLRVNASDTDSWQNLTISWVARNAGNNTVGGLGTPANIGGNPASSQVTFTPTGTGTFSVTATASDGIGGTASHAFTIVATCWDNLELNNGVSNATAIPSNTTADYFNLSICGVDVDVFVLNITTEGSIDVEVRRAAPSLQLTIRLCYMLLDLDDAIASAIGSVADTTVTLNVSGLGAGTYYIHIGAVTNAVDVYDITISAAEP